MPNKTKGNKKEKSEKAVQPKEQKYEQDENREHFTEKMSDVKTIIERNSAGVPVGDIASDLRVAPSFVEDVLAKGAEQMEIELRETYQLPKKEDDVPTDVPVKKSRKAKEPKAAKEPKEPRVSLRTIMEELAPTKQFTAQEMIDIVNEKHPGKYKENTIRLHLSGLDKTNPSAEKNFPSLHKHAFLRKIGEGKDAKYSRR